MRARQVTALAAALVLCSATGASAQTEPLIAYDSWGDVVKLVRPDGTERRVLTKPSARTDSFNPAWSPDGRTLGFVRQTAFDDESDRPVVAQVILHDVASGVSRVIARNAGFGGLAFAPGGASVVYGAEVSIGGGEELTQALYLVGSDGSAPRALTRPTAITADDSPAWSPDGGTIAFTRSTRVLDGDRIGQESRIDIWTVPAAGGDARRLVADAEDPDWSPDGRQIVFATTRDRNGQTCDHDCFPNREIYVANADGSDLRRLTFTETDEGSPAWSPDGSQIAFHSARPRPGDYAELYAMRADGSCATRLTNTSVANFDPVWRPGAASAAPLECDGAVPGAMTPAFETDLTAALRFERFPLTWVGELYDDVLLSAVDVDVPSTFIYDDCGLVGRECAFEGVQVQTEVICNRDPLRYGGYSGPGRGDMAPHVTRYRRVGGALVAEHESGTDIYTGRLSVTLFGPTYEEAVEIARDLAVFPTARSALAAPRFGSRTLLRLRRVRGELRRVGMRELSRRWRMSRDQINAAVKLRGVLSSAELKRGTARCR